MSVWARFGRADGVESIPAVFCMPSAMELVGVLAERSPAPAVDVYPVGSDAPSLNFATRRSFEEWC